MPASAETVEHEIFVRPIEIGIRQIDAGGAARAAGGGIDGRTARVAEQIQKIGAFEPSSRSMPRTMR